MVEMAPTALTDFYDQSAAKIKLSMDLASTKYDEDLDRLGEQSNRSLEDILTRHSGTIQSGSALTGALKQSGTKYVLYDVCYNFKIERKASRDEILSWKEVRNEAKQELLEKLAADPTTNTQNEFVQSSSDYQSSELS